MKKLVATMLFVVAFNMPAYGEPTKEPELNLAESKSRIVTSTHQIVMAPDKKTIWGYSYLTGKWDSYDLSKTKSELSGQTTVLNYSYCISGNRIVAFSAHTGKWSWYDFPSDNEAEIIPVLSTNILAMVVDEQMVGFSSIKGKWDSVKIDPSKVIYKPGSFQIIDQGQQQKLIAQVPLTGNHVAGGIIGDKAYAFSDSSAKWQVVEFSEGENPVIVLGNNYVEAKSKNYLYIFSDTANKWAGIKFKQNKDGTTSLERVK